MRGQRIELTINRCKINCCSWKNRWEWTQYAKQWDDKSGQAPWDEREPKKSCDIDGEKCFSMNDQGRWKDRFCSDTLRVLCEKGHTNCDPCSTKADCDVGNYRTTCPAGSKVDSKCEACTNDPAQCNENHHRVQCTSGTATNPCTACRTNSPTVLCPWGQWLKACDQTENSDTSRCESCNDVDCGNNKYKVLCNPNRMTKGDNTCASCDHTVCLPGFYLTRCTGNPLSDTSSCNECTAVTCGSGQYWQQCVVPEQAHTCQTCTTKQNCGAGYFRPACTGTQREDIQCSACTDTISCQAGQYRIPCNGDGQSSSTCTSCPSLTTSPEGSSSITQCTCIADYVLHNGGTICTRCGADPHATGTVKIGLECQFCEAGKFRTSLMEGTCTACPTGKFKVSGVAECSDCGAGKYSSNTGARSESTCLSCVPETFSTHLTASSIATCSNCLAGTFSVSFAASICSQCNAGYSQPTAGSIQCNTACLPGTRSSAGAGTCANCNAGTFQASPEQRICTACAAGTISADA